MDTSIYLARLIGPLLLVSAAGPLMGGRTYRAMVEEFLASRALIYLAGFMTLLLGVGIVNVHNVWTLGWPLLLTILGWLFVVSGVFRMLLPDTVREAGTAVLARPGVLTAAGIAYLLLGLGLSYIGYVR